MNKLDFNQKSIQVVLLQKRLKEKTANKVMKSQHLDGDGANDKNNYDVNEDDNVEDRKNVESSRNSGFLLS